MSLQGIKSPFDAYKEIEKITKPQAAGETKPAEGGKGFGEMFTDAIKEVNTLQKTADSQVENLVLGKSGTSPHEAMISLEKANVAFQLMNTVRTRIISAYQEVMRAQV